MVIRQLTYGSAANNLDGSLKIGEQLQMEAKKNFVEGVISGLWWMIFEAQASAQNW